MVRGWSPSKMVFDSPDLQPTWSLLQKIKKGDEIQKISISETTGSIGTKLCLVLWWPPFKIVSGNPDIQPTWPLLLKTEKVDEILIVFLWQSRPRAKISGRCYYLLTILCTLSMMQGFTCLIKSYKTNMFWLFQWNIVLRRI